MCHTPLQVPQGSWLYMGTSISLPSLPPWCLEGLENIFIQEKFRRGVTPLCRCLKGLGYIWVHPSLSQVSHYGVLKVLSIFLFGKNSGEVSHPSAGASRVLAIYGYIHLSPKSHTMVS